MQSDSIGIPAYSVYPYRRHIANMITEQKQWIPELKKRLDGIPFVLVGTLADVRTETTASLGGPQLVTFEQVRHIEQSGSCKRTALTYMVG